MRASEELRDYVVAWIIWGFAVMGLVTLMSFGFYVFLRVFLWPV